MEADFACGTQKMPTEFSFLGWRPTLLLLSLLTAATSSWAAPALTPAQAAANLTAPDLALPADETDAAPLSDGTVRTYAVPEAGLVMVTPPVVSVTPVVRETVQPEAAPVTPTAETPAAADLTTDPKTDELFINTYRAYQKKDAAAVTTGAETLATHPLAIYPELWNLLLQLSKSPQDAKQQQKMTTFISRHHGDYIAERARTDWARIAAEQNNAERFRTLYRRLDWNQTESDLVCSKARFDLADAVRTKKSLPAALTAAHRVLLETGKPDDGACVKLRSAYLAADPKAAWPVFLILMQQKRFNQARELATLTNAKQFPVNKKALSELLTNPTKWYKRHAKRLNREPAALLLVAALRLASSDTQTAAKIAESVSPRLSAARRSLLWSRVGLEAALNLDESASAYFARAGKMLGTAPDTVGKNFILTWNARAALRTGDWKKVLAAVNKLPPALKRSDAWIYWRARGLEKTGHPKKARQLFASISGHTEFYGLLACEALGKPYPDYQRPAPIPNASYWDKNPSVQRALAFYRLDLNAEGNREWNWALRKLKTDARLNLAAYAGSRDLFHREINTSEATPTVVFSQRYPRPHQTDIENAAQTAELDPAWVYGLIRQESRFVRQARSSVGAQGMMQVMPRTARWVAAHLALNDFSDEQLTDTSVNLTIGCRYLKLVADAFEGSMPLATAAYNAGPSRSAAWRAKLTRAEEGAVFAETIPFTETRNYVQRVLANTVHYASYYNSDKNVIKLSAILGTVTPKPIQNVALP